uniref:Ig-like domain-containing protein n=1 Tax=Echeneis naucrates TaxID=173247 RepID=A0A665WE73_ECHNA
MYSEVYVSNLIIIFLYQFRSRDMCLYEMIFETKTVGVGEDVKLTCPRLNSSQIPKQTTLFWIRLVSGNFPEILGGTFSFDYDGVNESPRFTAKQEPGTFLLHINKIESSDTGMYYCIDTEKLDLKFLKGTFLRVKGAEPEITTNFQLPPSDPVRPGDSVTLQCSVLFDSEKKTCPGDHSVYWFRAGSDEAHPSFIYAHGNNSDHCKKSPESESTQKCDYFFSKNVSSSDAGTHYCAVATCGEILFGNGTKLEIEKLEIEGKWRIFLYNCDNLDVACSLFIFYFFKHLIGMFTSNQIMGDEDRLTYSAPTFTRRKAGKVDRRNEKAVEKETVYSGVRAL